MKREIRALHDVETQASASMQRVSAYWDGTHDQWSDEVREQFGHHHLDPLKERARQFDGTLHALIEALEDAEQDLG